MAGHPRLTDRQRAAAVAAFEPIEGEPQVAADFLDDHDEVRAAAALLAAGRSVLAAAYLVRSAGMGELLDVVEGLPARSPDVPRR